MRRRGDLPWYRRNNWRCWFLGHVWKWRPAGTTIYDPETGIHHMVNVRIAECDRWGRTWCCFAVKRTNQIVEPAP